MNKIIKNYSVKNLKTKINKYGFKYSTKDFVIETIIILAVIYIIAYLSRLEFTNILILIVVTLILIPFLINAWFYQSYSV